MRKNLRASAPNRASVVASLVLFFLTLPACAIDNPDAPDYLGEFRKEAERLELNISEGENSAQMAKSSSQYEKFLDDQLNTAYQALQGHLAAPQKAQLKASQQAWLRYRDAEVEFIASNWTSANFGSSALISKRAYIATITRSRVEQLLAYLKNY